MRPLIIPVFTVALLSSLSIASLDAFKGMDKGARAVGATYLDHDRRSLTKLVRTIRKVHKRR